MSIHFKCMFCGAELEAEDELAGRAMACLQCNKVCSVPQAEGVRRKTETLRLKTPVQKQVFENVSESSRECPDCKASNDPRELVCHQCGYNFVLKKRAPSAEKKGRFADFLGGIGVLLLRVLLLCLLVGGGFIGFVWIQQSRLSDQIRSDLQERNLTGATEKYRKLASWHGWFEYVGRSNPWKLRYEQFQMRQGKKYAQTLDPKHPLVVYKCVWGTKSEVFSTTAWVKFWILNLSDQPLPVKQEYFLLLGMENRLSPARTNLDPNPGSILLQKSEAVEGNLYFGGILKPPTFLEYNNGNLIVRAPVYVNYAMDNYNRDQRDWPSGGRGELEFPFNKPWSESKLSAQEIHKLWQDYASMPPPPAEPYTTVYRETNPR